MNKYKLVEELQSEIASLEARALEKRAILRNLQAGLKAAKRYEYQLQIIGDEKYLKDVEREIRALLDVALENGAIVDAIFDRE
jgi:hypothetical protein